METGQLKIGEGNGSADILKACGNVSRLGGVPAAELATTWKAAGKRFAVKSKKVADSGESIAPLHRSGTA